MKISTFKTMMISMLMSCISVSVFAQKDLRMDFHPATAEFYASLNVYSTESGQFDQFYVKDGKWVKNPNIPQPKINLTGGGLRMKYFAPATDVLAGLFVYSTKNGQFEFFYLKGGTWVLSEYLPGSKITLNSQDVRLDFIPAGESNGAYITAHTVDANEFGIWYLADGVWKRSDLYP